MPTREMRLFLQPALASFAALMVVLGCGGHSVTEPHAAALVVTYAEPASFPPPGDPGCTHHNAPSFLVVDTDSGLTGRLEPREGAFHSTTLEAPTPGDHWLRVFDYRFCSTGCPNATSGVSINGVALNRVAPPGAATCPVVWFHQGADGTTSP